MARSEARIYVDIWDDDDFIKLSSGAQRAYFFIISQSDLAQDGVIALRVRRWARKCAGIEPDELERHLRELDDARFLVIDWDTEEVLVRSHVRRDRVYTQPNIMRAAAVHIAVIESKAILRTLAAEVERIRAEVGPLSDQQELAISEMEKALAERVPAEPQPSTLNPSQNPSADPSANPLGDRGGYGSAYQVPLTPSSFAPDPSTTPVASLPSSSPPRAKTARSRRRIPDDFAVTDAMKAWAREHTPLVGQRETDAFIDYWRGSGTTKADWESTWRNWMRKAQTDAERHNARASPPPAQKPSTTDQRVAQGLAIADQLRREREAKERKEITG